MLQESIHSTNLVLFPLLKKLFVSSVSVALADTVLLPSTKERSEGSRSVIVVIFKIFPLLTETATREHTEH